MTQLNRRRFLCGLGGLAVGGVLPAQWAAWGPKQDDERQRLFQRSGRALGTEVSLTVVHSDPTIADRALMAAFESLEQVERLMSLYRPDSQISRLNRDGVLRNPHPDLLMVLVAAEELSRRTAGAFDITVQPLWSLFSNAAKEGRIPAPDDVAQVRSRVNWRSVEISGDAIRLRGTGTQITLNGIAQGFAVDQVTAALQLEGIEHALIDTGELAGLGRKPAAEPWRVGIQDPRNPDAYSSLAELNGGCLATSGDYATTFTPDRTQHHILDPRTGQSPTELASVSVLAASGLLADGLSTAVCVLGVEEGRKLLASIPNAEAFFITKTGRTVATNGFPTVG